MGKEQIKNIVMGCDDIEINLAIDYIEKTLKLCSSSKDCIGYKWIKTLKG